MSEQEDVTHCHGRDRLCTCPCIQENGLRLSHARDERGRICMDCDFIEKVIEKAEKAQRESDDCICSWNELSGRSVCGLPCPVHTEVA